MRQAINARGRRGNLIVRYDIPEGRGVTWEQGRRDPHHYDLYGDRDELRRYLVLDFRIDVEIPSKLDSGERP